MPVDDNEYTHPRHSSPEGSVWKVLPKIVECSRCFSCVIQRNPSRNTVAAPSLRPLLARMRNLPSGGGAVRYHVQHAVNPRGCRQGVFRPRGRIAGRPLGGEEFYRLRHLGGGGKPNSPLLDRNLIISQLPWAGWCALVNHALTCGLNEFS